MDQVELRLDVVLVSHDPLVDLGEEGFDNFEIDALDDILTE